MKNTPTLNINARLKVTRVLCILTSKVRLRERVLLKKSWIEVNILLLLFISKKPVILY